MTKKTFFALIWVALSLGLVGGTTSHDQSSATNAINTFDDIDTTVNQGVYTFDEKLLEALRHSFSQISNKATGYSFQIMWHKEETEWHMFSLQSMDGENCVHVHDRVSEDCIYLVLGKLLANDWEIGIEGTSQFFELLTQIPENIVGLEAKAAWDSSNLPNIPALLDYKYPFIGTWTYTQGWHGAGTGGDGLDIGSSNSDKRILAAATGTITQVCRPLAGQTSAAVRIAHDDGKDLFYVHLKYNTLRPRIYEGQRVIQGQVLGELITGDLDDNCGYAFQSPNWGHLHWDAPSLIDGETLTVDGWTITMDHYDYCEPWVQGAVSKPPYFNCGGQLNNVTSTNVPIENPNQAPQLPTHNSPTNNSWTKTTLLQWTAGSDDNLPNSYPDFWVQVDNNSDFSSPEVSTGWGYLQTYLVASLAADQNYYWRVNQGDGELSSGWTTAWLFKLDRALPFVNCNLSGPGSGNGWYTGTVNVACSAHDNTGTNNSGLASTSYLLDGVSQPATFQVTNEAAHTVTYSATDNAGNTASGSKSAGVDWTAPVINSIAINNGASVTHSANVIVNFTYTEALSGPWEMCASLNQTSWTCETFDTAMAFSLPNLNQTTHTVYFRLEDRAGNLSTVVSDSIYLDLYPAMPSSTSYQLCQGTVAAAAGTSSSANYQLVTNLVVPGGTSTSSSYQLTTGISQGCIAPGGNTYLPLMVRSIN